MSPQIKSGIPPNQSLVFERWPRFAARHPKAVLVTTLALVLLFGCLYIIGRGTFGYEGFRLPGSESQELFDMLAERFPAASGDTATVAVRASAGMSDPQVMSRIEGLVDDLEVLPDVVGVASPYETPAAISADGTIARLTVQYAQRVSEIEDASAHELIDVADRHSTAGFTVEAGGQIVESVEGEAPGQSELIGAGAATIILLIAFGSVVAMGLPLVTALIALASGFFLVSVGASYVNMATFTVQFSAMIGIGVGIDYSLLMVTRFRENLEKGYGVDDAIVRASSTAGRAVLFAGGTVLVALLGLWAANISFVGYLGTAAALVVAFAVLAALFVLPAMLKLTGSFIDRWKLPGYSGPIGEGHTGVGYRLSRFVQRFPVPGLVVSLGILLLLSAPVLDLELGTSDAGNNPESYGSRKAYNLLAEGFNPGFNGPLLVGVQIEDAAAVDGVQQMALAVTQADNVAGVSPPVFNEDMSAAVVTVIPDSAPQDAETVALVHDLREAVDAPFAGTESRAFVGGMTALFVDVGDKMEDGLPLFFTAVIGISFFLLMVVFRSVIVPLKAAVMNLLSIGASYGVLVAIFQWGWLGGILNVQREGPIESFMPMTLFAVLFGLSMDYEVFLVSRIREEYLETGDNSEAVARGLSVTTRLITAAAAIMIAVFMSFAISDQRVVKEFGIGLAVAVFLDATLVRLVLVPSLMQIMGNANWWFPKWLDRIVPRIAVDEAVSPGRDQAPASVGD
ncbi:MAG TPA: MMPL family transporter [Dehalococcoidia bacterium]